MRRLARAVGVDADQCRALVVAAVRQSIRTSSFGQPRMRRDLSGATALLTPLILYSLYGAGLAALVWIVGDRFAAGFVAMTYTIVLVAMTVLIDHNDALTSANDYAILGYRPVGSRTYLAARLLTVLIYTTGITAVLAWFPVIAFGLRHGVGVAVASLLAFFACATTSALAMLLAYGWLLHVVGPGRLRRALSFVQVGLSFLSYGGLMLVDAVSPAALLETFDTARHPWLVVWPGTWYAMYLELAAGRRDATPLVLAALSVVAAGAIVRALTGRLSLDYTARLGATITAADARAAPPARRGPGWWFRSSETRAMALLIRSQFRDDQAFRMTVLGILPLTVIYAVLALKEGRLADPFVPAPGRGNLSLITVAALIFPQTLQMAVSRSASYRAAWIFFATPIDPGRLVRSCRNAVLVIFVMPYLLALAGLLTWALGSPLHAAIHVALLGLLGWLGLQALVLIDPALPFSRPAQGRHQSARLIGTFLVVTLLGHAVVAFASRVAYPSPVRTAGLFAGLILVGLGLDWLTGWRLARWRRHVEFSG